MKLRTPADKAQAITAIVEAELPCRVEIVEGDDRSNPQNATAHLWFGEMAKHHGWSPDYAKCFAKLHYGVPILRRESPDFCATYDRVIKPLPYPQKLEAMRLISVTSLMTKGQMNEFMTTLETEQRSQGVYLTDPSEPACVRAVA